MGSVHWMGKVNFVEIRSFWHIFRSFDRMWFFLILSLQVSCSFLSTFTLLQFSASLSLLTIAIPSVPYISDGIWFYYRP